MAKSKLLIFVLMFINIISISSANTKTEQLRYNVKYVSAQHVYIDAGRDDNLAVGDTLRIFRDEIEIAQIEIVYVSDNSSSGKIITQTGEITPGDSAALLHPKAVKPASPEAQSDTATSITHEYAASQPIKDKPKTIGRIHGRVAFQLYRYDDKSPADLDITRPTLRLVLSSQNTGIENLSFNLNMRSRQDSRSGGYSRNLAYSDWHNKIYEFSIAYGNNDSGYRVRLGRIITSNISGVGYIDGLLLESQLIGPTRICAFAGYQPEWQYAEFRTSLQKYGACVTYLRENREHYRVESTLALAGEYHGSTISREFIYMRDILTWGERTRIYHSMNIDINRQWRREKMGGPLTLSSFLLSLRYKLSQSMSTGLSYDNRKNYWTYDNRTLDEQLFDTNMRQGLRGDVNMRLRGQIFFNMGMGYKFRKDSDERTWSYLFGIRKTNLTSQRFYLSLNYAGFNSRITDGNNVTARLGKYFRRGDDLSVYYGIYQYKYASTSLSRNSKWLGLTGNFRLVGRYYLYADYQYGFGKDIHGQRLTAEAGYRF